MNDAASAKKHQHPLWNCNSRRGAEREVRGKVDGGLEESGDDGGTGAAAASPGRARRGCTKVPRAEGKLGRYLPAPLHLTWQAGVGVGTAVGAAKQGSQPGRMEGRRRPSALQHSAAQRSTTQQYSKPGTVHNQHNPAPSVEHPWRDTLSPGAPSRPHGTLRRVVRGGGT
ncbi:hypothetical protein FDECE_1862 [Fusarium decemcellulare]|nr:hypothetical protein FDECE_1862 [Fusarium decemcellulare]